ncbi:nucleoplasmin-like [Lacerta agilis]|uniref:nucleoplasmin-like n=1 Tax=Lacerta agilis TaxID=80427 RepID=UPI001419122C|nr:nucleoplasmin-like [Lacerta agilis]
MVLEDSTATTQSSRSEQPTCVIWGCRLDGKNPSYTFDIPEEETYDQQVSLRTVCLGENVKDEVNMVEIMPPKDSKPSTAVHIATLKLSVLPMATLMGLDLTPPVTFRLKSGSGPVYLAGQYLSGNICWVGPTLDEDEDEEVSSNEEEEMEASSKENLSAKTDEMEASPVKPVKAQSSKQAGTSKEEPPQPVQEESLGRRGSRGGKAANKGQLRL